MKTMYVYIMTNKNNTVLYVGVTNVYFETFPDEISAITREKYLKKCYRRTKEKLINEKNPQWNDLSENFY